MGELESQKVRLEELIARRGEELRTFRVHPQYEEYQEQADLLQSAIREINQENVTDRAMLSFYQESLIEERPPEAEKLAKMYQEAGVGWPDGVRKRLEDVQAFHDKLIVNRRAFLETEIARLTQAIARRTEEVNRRSNERADLLSVLDTHGALAEYTELQRLQNEQLAKLSAVNQRIANLKRIDEIRAQTRIERGQLQILARSFYEERRSDRERALSLFNQFSQALYDRPGELIIDVVEGGYRFNVEIERQDSQGVEQMKVFCYDLTLATLWAAKGLGPEFLIHDSTIFADVDERQKAHALELAARTAEARGFQYICCLNSDSIPQEDFSAGFSLQPYVRLELTDEGETGGLLGIRY
ncbi:MAG: ABC-three component system protein [Terriglobia bacterium]